MFSLDLSDDENEATEVVKKDGQNEGNASELALQEIDEQVRQKFMCCLRFPGTRGARSDFGQGTWIPFGADPSGAQVRLFCFYGAGKQAQDFKSWFEMGKEHFPQVVVCPVETPGHAVFRSRGVMENPHEIAEAFIEEVIEQLEDLPFALFGFSVGARIAYEVARRRMPLRLYIAGRAAPHIRPPKELWAPDTPPEDDHEATLRWAMRLWGTKEDQGRIERLIDTTTASGDRSLLEVYASSIWKDLKVGSFELSDKDTKGKELVNQLQCRIKVWEAGRDNTWPPEVILDTWNEYVVGAGVAQKVTYHDLAHDELCAASGEPILKDVLQDLTELLES